MMEMTNNKSKEVYGLIVVEIRKKINPQIESQRVHLSK
jgi:hypothetical protein